MVERSGDVPGAASQKLSVTVPLRTWERLERALEAGEAQSRSAAVGEAVDDWLDKVDLRLMQRAGGLLSDVDNSDDDYRSLRGGRKSGQ